MRKLVVLCVAAAMLLGLALPAAPEARAADIKIVGAVSVSGYDGLKADLDLMADMIGRPEMGKMADGMIALATQGRGLKRLDRTRPWGMLVGTDGEHVGGCAFVPVSDMKAVMGVLKGIAKDKVKEHENGLYEITGPKKTMYVQEKHKGWAFIVDDPAILEHVPADPAEALGGLNEQYSMAMRFYPANVPENVRKEMAKKAREHAGRHMKRHPRENDRQYEARQTIARHIRKQMAVGAKDLEEMTVGWKLDSSGRKGVLEAVFISKKGSETAKFLAPAAKTRTAFGGFALPDASLTMRGTGRRVPLPEGDIDKLVTSWREEVFGKIDKKAGKGDAEVAKELIDELLAVVRETAKSNRDDGALSVRLAPEAITLINGRLVADGPAIETIVKKAVGLAREKHPDAVDRIVKLDADKMGRVNLHLVSLPLDKCPRGEAISGAVGEKLDVVLGFGPRAVYLAAGRDAMQVLKTAIKDSRAAAKEIVVPVEMTLDLGALATSAAGCPSEKVQSKGKKALEVLEKAEGCDQIRFTVEAVERGVKLRLELDEGAFRLMAECPKRK
ncbi:MAG: hypothetical protein RBS80_23135 [Thermoguttaceae bacterium]|jgi:hypothetical protein|nr:hypothetical protein [Thermoguttaceae bacterium]